MQRRGQYSLIIFVIATFVLLSLTGVVSNIIGQQAEQIRKAQDLTLFGDYVNGIRDIQYQERQLGIDTAGFYLGSIGSWPRGFSKCGSARNLSSYWILKDIPYWLSTHETEPLYFYEGEEYSATDEYRVFRFRGVREGLYVIDIGGGNVSPFLLNGEFRTDNELYLPSGDHLVLVTNPAPLDNASPCDFTISCDNESPSSVFPAEMKLQRVIPEGSEYEECVPGDELIADYFERVLNKYFTDLDPLAWELISDFINSASLDMELSFPYITYDAVVEKVGHNALYLTFYPLTGTFFSIKHKGLIESSYQGGTLVHNAFDSDFARFKGAATELVKDEKMVELVNDVLDDHSYFELIAQQEIAGIKNPYFEDFLNTYYDAGLNFNEFDINDLDFENYFELDLKPFCLYYLKEVCQFMSNELDEHEIGNYDLYDRFTSKNYEELFGVSIEDLIEPCRKCYDVPRVMGPCTNISDPNCQECFRTASMGVPYQAAFNTVSDEGWEEGDFACDARVNELLVPLISSYLDFSLRDLEEELEERYGFEWRLDPSRLNITQITYLGVEDKGSLFNSSCSHCSDVDYSSSCVEFKPSLSPAELILNSNEEEGNLIQTNAISSVTGSINLYNKGTTRENSFLLNVFIDLYSGDPDDESFYESDYSLVGSQLTGFGYDYQPVRDEEVILDPLLVPGDEVRVELGEVFLGDDIGVGSDSHTIYVCVESMFNDEYELNDSCVAGTIVLCDDADDRRGCCPQPFTWFYGKDAVLITNLDFSSPSQVSTTSNSFRDIVVDDLNFDGDNDFIATDDRSVYSFINDGRGSFTKTVIGSGLSTTTNIGLGDFNFDGYSDIVLFDNEDDYLWLGSVSGFNGPNSIIPNRGIDFHKLVVSDFNLDKNLDIVVSGVSHDKDNIYLINGRGDGGFSSAYLITSLSDTPPLALGVGDFDVDGDDDIVFSSDQELFLLVNQDGLFGNPVLIGSSYRWIMSIEVADFNLDGEPDIVTGGNGGPVILWVNDGGVFTQQVLSPDSQGALVDLFIDDVDNNGYPDVLGGALGDYLYLWKNNGDLNFDEIDLSYGANGYLSVAAGDFNGDKGSDLLVGDGSGALQLLTNLGDANPYAPCCGDDEIVEETFFNNSQQRQIACVYSELVRFG